MSRIFIGGVPYRATEEDLADLFQQLGYAPTKLEILMEREDPSRSRGIAFCEVEDDLTDNFIQDSNGQTLQGRTLTVDRARPMAGRPARR